MDGWTLRRRRAHALVVLALASAIAVAFYAPLGAFLPACPIREHFGILCPGCGGTRALVALAHGRVGEAVRLNALLVMLLPFGVWFGAQTYRRALRPTRFEWPKAPDAAVYGLGAVAIVFAVVRNLA